MRDWSFAWRRGLLILMWYLYFLIVLAFTKDDFGVRFMCLLEPTLMFLLGWFHWMTHYNPKYFAILVKLIFICISYLIPMNFSLSILSDLNAIIHPKANVVQVILVLGAFFLFFILHLVLSFILILSEFPSRKNKAK